MVNYCINSFLLGAPYISGKAYRDTVMKVFQRKWFIQQSNILFKNLRELELILQPESNARPLLASQKYESEGLIEVFQTVVADSTDGLCALKFCEAASGFAKPQLTALVFSVSDFSRHCYLNLALRSHLWLRIAPEPDG